MTRRKLVVASLLSLAFPATALAQPNPDRIDPTVAPSPTATAAAPMGPPMDRASASFTPGGYYAFSSGLEDSRGDMAVTRSGGELTLFVPFDRTMFSLGLTNEWSWYDFSGGSAPVVAGSEKPFSQVTTVRISPGMAYRIDEKWALLGGVSADFSGETDADVSDAATYGGFFAVRYRFSDRFSLVVGAAGRSVLEDDFQVLPIIGIDWQITEKMAFATRGTGARLVYFLTPQFDLALQVSYENRDFRLSDDAAIPEGVVRDRRVTVGLQGQYMVRPWWVVRGEVGVVAWGEMVFEDRNGNGLEGLDTDPTPYVGASMTFRF